MEKNFVLRLLGCLLKIVVGNIFWFLILWTYSVIRFDNPDEWYSHFLIAYAVFAFVLILMGKSKDKFSLSLYLEKFMTVYAALVILNVITVWTASLIDNAYDVSKPIINSIQDGQDLYTDFELFFRIGSNAFVKSTIFALCCSLLYIPTRIPVSKLKSTPLSFSRLYLNIFTLLIFNMFCLFVIYREFYAENYYAVLGFSVIQDVFVVMIPFAMGKIAYEDHYKKYYEPSAGSGGGGEL